MYAVIRTGGKQYRVAPEDVIVIEKIAGDEGSIVQFAEVLMVGGNGSTQVGAPTVEGASVAGQVVTQGRGNKILVFKKKRRKNYRRKRGHRQELTTVRITEILTGGKKPAMAKAEAKPAPKKAADKQAKEAAKTAAKPAAKKADEKPKAEAKPKAAAKKPAPKQASAKPKAAAKKPPAKKPAAKTKKDS